MRIQVKLKEKPCKQCKVSFLPVRGLQTACSMQCAVKLAKALQEKKEAKEWKERKREGLNKLKTASEFKADLEEVINAIVRLIDKGHECISSKAEVYQVNAGHLYSVGAFPELRFNLLNIYAQSVHDNCHKGGNGVIYKERIKEVFGVEVSEEIENLKILYPKLQMSISEIKEAIQKARAIKRELEKFVKDVDKPFTTYQRITVRRVLNNRIGVYVNESLERKMNGYFDPQSLSDII